MRSYFSVTVLLMSFLLSNIHGFAAPTDAYSIKVKVHGVKDTLCYLGYHFGDKNYLKDSVKADSKGNFEFKGKEKLDGGIYLVILPGKKYFEILISKEQNFSLELDTSDFIETMKVKGSVENTMFYDYQRFIVVKGKAVDSLKTKLNAVKHNDDSTKLIKAKLEKIDNEVVDYKKNFMKEHPDLFLAKLFKTMQEIDIPEPPKLPDGKVDSLFRYIYYKTHFWDNIDFSDDRLVRTPLYHNKLKQYMQNMTMQIPDSINKEADFVVEKARASKDIFKYTVWYITTTYETSNMMGMDAVFVHMAEKYYTAKQAFWVDSTTLYKINDRARILKPLLIGKVAPNLTMKDTSGVYQVLHNVRAKYTILCFWDPDCGHCQKVVPKLDTLYKTIKSKGVEVFAVCTEVEMDKWKKFIREHHLNWLNVADPTFETNFRHIYDISSTPIIYILNDKKEIIAKKIGVEQINEILEMKWKENKKE